MGAITRGFANNILSGGTIDATDGLSGTVSSSNITDSSISSVTAFPAAAGDFIQSTASDPSPATIGDVWYNNATYAFKGAALTTAGAWASGGNLNVARYASAQAGTQTASITFGGFNPSDNNNTPSELYNGTSWTASPLGLSPGRMYATASGPQTSALIYGGDQFPSPRNSVLTETWNGTSFTTVASMNTAKSAGGGTGSGTQTATLSFGGSVPPLTAATESWNGSSWTSVNSMNTARSATTGAGISTAALCFGGTIPSRTAATESWNGSSWTTVNSMNTARSSLSGTGIQTSALAFGGDAPPSSAATELYNGTSWTTQTSMGTARYILALGNCGTAASALAVGGQTGGINQSITEEFTGAGAPVTQTITTS